VAKPILVINVKDDPTRPFFGTPDATPAIAQVSHWATANGCPPPPTASNSTTTGNTPHRVTTDNYLCPLAPVRFVVLETGGHLWPDAADGLGYDANTEVLNWFMTYTTP
jgi:poly(3-hydroxybutyrate) depolymerase